MGQGFLIPDHYVRQGPSRTDMNLASIVWGLSLAIAIFSATKGIRQTWQSRKRAHKWSTYVILIWAEWFASVTISVISWCFLRGYIQPSFQYFFFTLCLWTVQIQAIMQIIINRIQFLMLVRRNATYLKWGVFIILSLINISVFIIWIPARLQISRRWVDINNVWDRCEKGIFLIIDLSLNIYFIYLVRKGLIANGLTKYVPLFRFNIFMIGISMAMDILIIAMMSLPTDTIYVQFHPLAYLVKLYIEMNMADLIAKVVKASNPFGDAERYGPRSRPTVNHRTSHREVKLIQRPSSLPPSVGRSNSLRDEEIARKETGLQSHVDVQKDITPHVLLEAQSYSRQNDSHISDSSSTQIIKRD